MTWVHVNQSQGEQVIKVFDPKKNEWVHTTRLIIVLDVTNPSDLDEEHPEGLSDEGYKRLTGKLNDMGLIIHVGNAYDYDPLDLPD